MHVNLDRLKGMIDPTLLLYVLVDPLVGEPMPAISALSPGASAQLQRQQAWDREVAPVVLATSVALSQERHPYLVKLHGPDDPLLELTLRIAEEERVAAQSGGLKGGGGAPHRIGGWLQSEMPADAVADMVSAMCRVNTDAITSARYLRMPDRRVLEFLSHVAGTARVAGQFGRLQSWVYLDPMAQLQHLRSSDEHAVSLRLATHEWRRLERGEIVNRAIAKFLGELAAANAPTPPSVYAAAEQAVIEADSAARRWPQRFPSSADEATWAALLLIHPSLARVPAVQDLLNAADPSDVPPEPVRYLHVELAELARLASADSGI